MDGMGSEAGAEEGEEEEGEGDKAPLLASKAANIDKWVPPPAGALMDAKELEDPEESTPLVQLDPLTAARRVARAARPAAARPTREVGGAGGCPLPRQELV